MGLGGPQNRSEHFGEETQFLHLPEMENPYRPARDLAAVLTTLRRLLK